MSNAYSLQAVIQSLHTFWAGQGCMIGHPHSEKVGAGTMNPATFLRVLGPEPWRVGYVEPSFRSDDGRYAENPNRMQMHTQYQVILKPDPGNPQELYLASLAALGLDLARHDIRFVEDNWESPALGAWGLGWEVWLDGQEITQFTYFQQAGGQVLDPVSVEITYGLERITMYLQGRREVWSIDVDGRHSYADLYRTHEVEHSRYNFDIADIDRLHQMNALYQAEADRCLEQGLVHPAHDWVIRQSHTFNLLDSRGAIGVTERAQYFAGMRRQARSVAELYVEQRLRDEYPFLAPEEDGHGRAVVQAASRVATGFPEEPADLLFEIGLEEMPAAAVPSGIAQLESLLAEQLATARLAYGAVEVSGTVRRLVAQVRNLAPAQAPQTTERRGPSVKIAFDSDGVPTRAAVGFARGQGLPVSRLEVRGDHVYAVRTEAGQPAGEVLPDILGTVLDGFNWGRAMRWDGSSKEFIRPVRWLLVLLGDSPVPFTWGELTAATETRAPRWQELGSAETPGAVYMEPAASQRDWHDRLAASGIVLDREQRRAEVLRQVQAAASACGGRLKMDDDLLDEVTDLVEAPQAVSGEFPEEFLDLPVPVLITVMRKHQRYFPLYAANRPDTLLPRFVTVANGVSLKDPDLVRTGNESVINARFSDAAFFVERDLATPLAERTPRLGSLVFHARLGSMLEKVERLQGLVLDIGRLLELDAEELCHAKRAAGLCKSDLVTSMVIEMTSLQGTMGAIYARASGEPEAVCTAIREHHLPRQADDAVPESAPGVALALADRLDSLTGLMAAGVVPRGSADPFGLRRLAIGLVSILLERHQSLDLAAAVDLACSRLPLDAPEGLAADVLLFIQRRLRVAMQEHGLPMDVVDAVMASPWPDPRFRFRTAQELAAVAADAAWHRELEAYSRCVRILPKDEDWSATPVGLPPWMGESPDAPTTIIAAGPEPAAAAPADRSLLEALIGAEAAVAGRPPSVAGFRAAMCGLTEPVAVFFDEVMVMAEDADLQAYRLGLMARVARLGVPLGDLVRLRPATGQTPSLC